MLSAVNHRLECPKALLISLVKTVEVIVDVSVSKHSVFFLTSSKTHLHEKVKGILKHGAKIKHHVIYSQPSFAAFDQWLEQSLLDFSLVAVLLPLRNDLDDLYYEWAFLRNDILFEAFVDALYVLSTRDVAPLLKILTTMEATLQLNAVSQSQIQDMPISGDPLLASLTRDTLIAPCLTTNSLSSSPSPSLAIDIPGKRRDDHDPEIINPSRCKLVLKDDTSTVIDEESPEANVPNFSYSYQSPVSSPPVESLSGVSAGLCAPKSLELPTNRDPQGKEKDKDASSASDSASASASIIEYGAELTASLISRHKSSSDEGKSTTKKVKGGWNESFLESGGLCLPPAIGHFPTPQKGQTLTSFLTSLSDNLPDLDRENAHFNVSEALISAFERIKIQKFQDRFKTAAELQEEGETDEGSKNGKEDMFGTVSYGKDERDDAGSSKWSRRHRNFKREEVSVQNVLTETEESELEYWRQPRKPPPYLRKKPRACLTSSTPGLVPHTSSSLTSSEDDDLLSSSYSAENVALNLLRNSKVRDNQIPPASELQWIVSEHEAPQALLPLPKVTSESESDYNSGTSLSETSIGKIDNHIRLRGNQFWAPPRPQIIFTLPPSPSINMLIKTQKCRCAGCGTKVDLKYASTFRYCFYLGRYFCTGCHTGKKARLPQMIIHQWDFSPHPVSNFSATLLEKLQSDPVYNILAINKDIYKKVKLNNFRNHRIQLGILIEYIQNCKSANYLRTELGKFPQYYSSDVDLYSLNDLVNLRFSMGLPVQTKEFVITAIKHVLSCELCKGLGFICEICNKNEILFPFQINRITRCSHCASVFHLKCFSPVRNTCPKCLRISARRSNETDLLAGVAATTSESLNISC